MSMFKASEKCNKDLRCTFITIKGVKTNKNSDVVDDQIKLDDLFE